MGFTLLKQINTKLIIFKILSHVSFIATFLLLDDMDVKIGGASRNGGGVVRVATTYEKHISEQSFQS